MSKQIDFAVLAEIEGGRKNVAYFRAQHNGGFHIIMNTTAEEAYELAKALERVFQEEFAKRRAEPTKRDGFEGNVPRHNC